MTQRSHDDERYNEWDGPDCCYYHADGGSPTLPCGSDSLGERWRPDPTRSVEPQPDLVPWFIMSTDYWHLWFNMRDGASSPRTTDDVRVRYWDEYWQHADAAGYHPDLMTIRPEDCKIEEYPPNTIRLGELEDC